MCGNMFYIEAVFDITSFLFRMPTNLMLGIVRKRPLSYDIGSSYMSRDRFIDHRKTNMACASNPTLLGEDVRMAQANGSTPLLVNVVQALAPLVPSCVQAAKHACLGV